MIDAAFHSPRRAFSLIEVMVVITLSALLLGVALSLLLGLRQWDRRTRERAVTNEQRSRLAETLRADVRQGSDVLLSVEGPLVVMSAEGKQQRYELSTDGCVRKTIAGDATERADQFTIGPAARWQVDRIATGRRPLVAVTLARSNGDGPTRSAPLVVYAALGADLPPEPAQEARP